MTLPDLESVPSGRQRAILAGLFAATTNSYKFTLFLTLLDQASRHDGEGDLVLSMRQLLGGMLSFSWFPSSVCRLSFGVQDRTAEHLARVGTGLWVDGDDVGLQASRAACYLWAEQFPGSARRLRSQTVLRYVVSRLIGPFLDPLPSPRPSNLDSLLDELSRSHFDSARPFYRIDEGSESVTIHPFWLQVFKREGAILDGWAKYHWLQYLQRCNPGTPGIAAKLSPPSERRSLQEARTFWLRVIATGTVKCPYSGRTLGREVPFDVDHFLPWSFVMHDQLWNLIPADPEVNRQKRRSLADKSYVPVVGRAQIDALAATARTTKEGEFTRIAESHVLALQLPAQVLRGERVSDREQVLRAFERAIVPLWDLAASRGFPGPWLFAG